MGRKGRRNAKRLRAIAEIQRMRKSSRKALGRMKNKKGRDAEMVGSEISGSLLRKGLIQRTKKSERYSFMDVVSKVDRVIWRASDGMPVPIQFKSFFVDKEEKEKYKFFEKQYGQMPVFMAITPRDTDLDKLEAILLRKVDEWKGYFKYRDWQFKYSKFFDFENYPGFGMLRKRIDMFFSEKEKVKTNEEVFELNPS